MIEAVSEKQDFVSGKLTSSLEKIIVLPKTPTAVFVNFKYRLPRKMFFPNKSTKQMQQFLKFIT
jgi:hypothetical protein